MPTRTTKDTQKHMLMCMHTHAHARIPMLALMHVSSALAPAAVVSAFFDYMLKFGADKACIISSTTGKEVCGYVLDESQEGCVLTDHDGWQCA